MEESEPYYLAEGHPHPVSRLLRIEIVKGDIYHTLPGGTATNPWLTRMLPVRSEEAPAAGPFKMRPLARPLGPGGRRAGPASLPHILLSAIRTSLLQPMAAAILDIAGWPGIALHNESLTSIAPDRLPQPPLPLAPGFASLRSIRPAPAGQVSVMLSSSSHRSSRATEWMGKPLGGGVPQPHEHRCSAVLEGLRRRAVTLIEWKYTDTGYGFLWAAFVSGSSREEALLPLP